MFAKKTDGRFRIEMKFNDGNEAWLVNDDYKQIGEWYDLIKKPLSDAFAENVLEAVLYDRDKPLASWTNSAALCDKAA